MAVLVVHTWVPWVVPIAIAVVFGLMRYAIGHAPVRYLTQDTKVQSEGGSLSLEGQDALIQRMADENTYARLHRETNIPS
jgi:hypothetical protein